MQKANRRRREADRCTQRPGDEYQPRRQRHHQQLASLMRIRVHLCCRQLEMERRCGRDRRCWQLKALTQSPVYRIVEAGASLNAMPELVKGGDGGTNRKFRLRDILEAGR